MIDDLAVQMTDFVSGILTGTQSRIAPLYLLTTIGISLALYRRRKGHDVEGFWQWAAPPEIYRHASHITDIKLFVLGTGLSVFGLFNATVVRTVFTVLAVAMLSGGGEIPAGDWGAGTTLFATIALVLVNDFCVYWTHRLHHEWPVVWPFHAVHHSAEVMTPLTLYRKHPVYDLLSGLFRAAGGGIIFGVLLASVGTGIDVISIGGANILYVLFSGLGANLRHTHIWLAYPRWLEHVLISPAQHQIHHSVAPEHYNKNYGEVFAFWDWWFGSLHLSGPRQTLAFGLSDGTKEKARQPHPTLVHALIVPFLEARNVLRRSSASPTAEIAGRPEARRAEQITAHREEA